MTNTEIWERRTEKLRITGSILLWELRASELRGNPYHDEKGRFTTKNSLTSSSESGKIKEITANDDGSITVNYKEEKPKAKKRTDKNGIPFKYDTIYLEPKEYKNVVDEIGRTYSKYEGKKICLLNFTNKSYAFENRGIGDYNIFEVIE